VEAQLQGEFATAEACYLQALAIEPGYAFSQLALAQLHMMNTRFHAGRDVYEARFAAVTEGSGPDWRGLPFARWRGESLAGKKLYLWAEQGLGDIMMFAGFLSALLAQKPARIALGMFPKLIPVFARSFAGIDVEPVDDAANHALMPTMLASFPQIEQFAELSAVPFSLAPLRASYEYANRHGLFDYAAPMGDVLVHCLPSYIPAEHQASVITPQPQRVDEAKGRLVKLGEGRRIGIAWHTDNKREPQRNVPLQEWVEVLRAPGCRFVSLQHRVSATETDAFCSAQGCSIYTDPQIDPVQDAEGLIALVAAMDEVITIDNSVAHIAGVLGVKTTLLLPRGHNFRWPVLEGGGTLWYKHMRVLRQENAADWREVMEKVKNDLFSGLPS